MLTAALRSWGTTAFFLAAILTGSITGRFAPGTAAAISGFADPLILLLVGALFFTLRLDGLPSLRRAPRTVLLAVGVNFLLIPLIAFPLTLLLPDEALRLGVLIYCLAPCTDWFLGFTRLAGGDTTTGAALIPVQMVIQLCLYPLWIALFAGNIGTILADIGGFGWVLLGVFLFFLASYALGEGISRIFRLRYPEHALLTMTTSARNAPLMLALTVVALPEQPVVHAAIVLGMLIEFPHLTVITRLLRRRRPEPVTASDYAMAS